MVVDHLLAQLLLVGADQATAEELPAMQEEASHETCERIPAGESARVFPARGTMRMMAECTFGRGQNTVGGSTRTTSASH